MHGVEMPVELQRLARPLASPANGHGGRLRIVARRPLDSESVVCKYVGEAVENLLSLARPARNGNEFLRRVQQTLGPHGLQYAFAQEFAALHAEDYRRGALHLQVDSRGRPKCRNST